jgi:antitoxin Phd
MKTSRWQLQDAKDRFSEVMRNAQREGPQTITLHGKDAVVVIAADEFTRISRRKGSLVEFFRASPLVGSGLDIDRSKDTGRKIEP